MIVRFADGRDTVFDLAQIAQSGSTGRPDVGRGQHQGSGRPPAPVARHRAGKVSEASAVVLRDQVLDSRDHGGCRLVVEPETMIPQCAPGGYCAGRRITFAWRIRIHRVSHSHSTGMLHRDAHPSVQVKPRKALWAAFSNGRS